MPETADELVWLVLRSSAFLTVGFLLVWSLLKCLRVCSVRIQTLAWFGVLMQGLALIPLNIEVPVISPAESLPTAAGFAVPHIEQEHRPETSPASRRFPLSQGFTQRSIRLSPAARNVEPSESFAAVPATTVSAVVAAVWIAGVVLTISWLLVAYVGFLVLLPGTRPLPENWQAEWNQLQHESGSTKRVRLHVTQDLGPAICWAPSGYRLLIPVDQWNALSHLQRQLVLRHELAHVQRGDLWKALCFRLAASVQWFNPFAWFAVQKLSECAEWSCDEVVRASSTVEPTEYVRALLEFSAPRHRIPSLIPTAAGHSVVRRAQRLLKPQLKEDSDMKKLMVLLIVAALATANGLTFELVAQEQQVATQTADRPAESSAKKDDSADPASAATDADLPAPHTSRIVTAPDSTDSRQLRAVRVLIDGVDVNPTWSEELTFVPADRQARVATKLRAERVLIDGVDVNRTVLDGVTYVPANRQARVATRQAVIDIAYIFKHLPEFNQLKESLKRDVMVQDQLMKAEAMSLKRIQEKLTMASPIEAEGLRTELTRQSAELDVRRNIAREKLKTQEAKIYATIFKKVRKAIADHAQENGIQMVRRSQMGREQQKSLDSGDPQAVFQAMNERILYVADEGVDITDEVLLRLTRETDSSPAAAVEQP